MHLCAKKLYVVEHRALKMGRNWPSWTRDRWRALQGAGSRVINPLLTQKLITLVVGSGGHVRAAGSTDRWVLGHKAGIQLLFQLLG